MTGALCGGALGDERLHVGVGPRVGHHLLVRAADGKDARLRAVDDGRELLEAEHAEVGDGEGAAAELGRSELVLSGSSSDILDLSRDLLKTLEVDVRNGGSHEAVVSLDGEAHIDIIILSNEVSHPRAVGLWHLDGGHGSSLNNKIIN